MQPERPCMGCASESTPVGRLWCARCCRGDIMDLPAEWHVVEADGLWVPLHHGGPLLCNGQRIVLGSRAAAVAFCRAEMGRAIRAQYLPIRAG